MKFYWLLLKADYIMHYNTPILFIIFNRPELTKLVLAKIRNIKPKYLFIAADGPRNMAEALICKQTRTFVLENIDWPCEVKTLFRKQNLGCKEAVSSAISWFFKNVPEGIILEDDCLPTDSFFYFCAENLKRYRNDERVWSISGNNFVSRQKFRPGQDSYYFSQYPHIWGWATWSRSWQKVDMQLRIEQLNAILTQGVLTNYFNDRRSTNYWSRIIRKIILGKINTWDTFFVFYCFLNNGLCVTPAVNLVDNLGFGRLSTHTKFNFLNILPNAQELSPIHHPKFVIPNRYLDSITDRLMFSRTPLWKRVIQWLSK
jgi:hypothetical protein